GKDDAAREAVELVLRVFGHETDDRRMQSETGQIADDDHCQPDENEDTILEFTHPARQNDLGQESDGGARNAYGKGNQRGALGARLRPATGQYGIELLRHGTKTGRDPAG